jgi:hypothetical protein
VFGIVLKSWQAAVVLICHTCLGGISVSSMWAIERLVEFAGGSKGMLIYDRWPVEYLFQTTDIAMIVVIGAFGLWETGEALRRKYGNCSPRPGQQSAGSFG